LIASPDKATKQKAVQVMQRVMARYPLGSEHDKLWLAAVEMLSYFAPEALNGLDLSQAKRDLAARSSVHKISLQHKPPKRVMCWPRKKPISTKWPILA